jgi:hypothetical protein
MNKETPINVSLFFISEMVPLNVTFSWEKENSESESNSKSVIFFGI